MLLKLLQVIIVPLTLIACTTVSNKPASPQETEECMSYRMMMTAPMDPLAMQQLKEKCLKSQNRS